MDKKVALVTGASRGIGQAIAKELSKTCDVVINYASSSAKAQEVLDSLEPGNHKMIQCDVSNSEQVETMMKEIVEAYGHIDILINNAGITKDNLLLRMKEEEFDDVININLKGTYNCIRHIARIMMKQRSGKIVNMSSVVGLCGNAGQANYAASKGGVIALTKSCAKELASRGINVNAIAPGFIQTDMTDKLSEDIQAQMKKNIPLQQFGTVEDVANCVAFLCSDASKYITGQVIAVDGGMVM